MHVSNHTSKGPVDLLVDFCFEFDFLKILKVVTQALIIINYHEETISEVARGCKEFKFAKVAFFSIPKDILNLENYLHTFISDAPTLSNKDLIERITTLSCKHFLNLSKDLCEVSKTAVSTFEPLKPLIRPLAALSGILSSISAIYHLSITSIEIIQCLKSPDKVEPVVWAGFILSIALYGLKLILGLLALIGALFLFSFSPTTLLILSSLLLLLTILQFFYQESQIEPDNWAELQFCHL
ncbi:MAG: hypothetical protein WDZ28_01395 [Simkaniaceae bacterium]